jgi:hypothetical protein
MNGKPERNRGAKRWSREDETALRQLVSEGREASEIASIMKRSYFGVCHRMRMLNRLLGNKDAKTSPPGSKRKRYSDADLTCGALSSSGHQLVASLWFEIRNDGAIAKRREPSSLRPEVECIIGAIVREGLICFDQRKTPTWRRIAIKSLRAKDVGVDSGVIRNLVSALLNKGFLDTFVGYIGPRVVVQLDPKTARSGRTALLRATQKMIEFCGRYGIVYDNLYSHFPSLRSDGK